MDIHNTSLTNSWTLPLSHAGLREALGYTQSWLQRLLRDLLNYTT